MANKPPTQREGFIQAIKKFFLSAFVIVTFIAYLLHQRLAAPAAAVPTVTVGPNTNPDLAVPGSNVADPTVTPAGPLFFAPPATDTPQAQGGVYKNGTFTGPEVDAFYGLVRVQVQIQNGKIANVQFLEYPSDRRTSREINSQVMPMLTQEAIQAQNGNVDLISGATLTSEAFVVSLKSALQSAQN